MSLRCLSLEVFFRLFDDLGAPGPDTSGDDFLIVLVVLVDFVFAFEFGDVFVRIRICWSKKLMMSQFQEIQILLN
jgi:hypothetical protein